MGLADPQCKNGCSGFTKILLYLKACLIKYKLDIYVYNYENLLFLYNCELCICTTIENVFKNHQNEKPKKDNNFPFIDQIKVLRVPL